MLNNKKILLQGKSLQGEARQPLEKVKKLFLCRFICLLPIFPVGIVCRNSEKGQERHRDGTKAMQISMKVIYPACGQLGPLLTTRRICMRDKEQNLNKLSRAWYPFMSPPWVALPPHVSFVTAAGLMPACQPC